MTNEELATQVLEQLKFGETITPLANDRIYDAALVTAMRKDEQFAAKKQELIAKACEWFRNQDEYIVEDGFIENFKKAMEEPK